MLNNSLCVWIWLVHVMDHLAKWHFGSIVHEIFFIPIFTPYHICELAYWLCFRPQICLLMFGHLSKGIWSYWLTMKFFFFGATHQCIFLTLMKSCPRKCIHRWNHFLHAYDFTPITHLCTQHLVCILENATWCYPLISHYEKFHNGVLHS